MGFHYLRIKTPDEKIIPPDCEEFSFDNLTEPITLTEPFYTQQKVVWMEPTPENIQKIQKEINSFKHR